MVRRAGWPDLNRQPLNSQVVPGHWVACGLAPYELVRAYVEPTGSRFSLREVQSQHIHHATLLTRGQRDGRRTQGFKHQDDGQAVGSPDGPDHPKHTDRCDRDLAAVVATFGHLDEHAAPGRRCSDDQASLEARGGDVVERHPLAARLRVTRTQRSVEQPSTRGPVKARRCQSRQAPRHRSR